MPLIVRVAVPVPLPRLFDYRVPDGDSARVGARVLVPFAGRRLVGVVLETAEHTALDDDQLKPIVRVLDAQPLLTDELRETLRWSARYYQHPIGEVVDAALPVVLRSARALPRETRECLVLTAAGQAALADPARRRATRISSLLEMLADGAQTPVALDTRLTGWRVAARALRGRGLAEFVPDDAMRVSRDAIEGPELNDAQRAAVDSIVASRGHFTSILLDGVTGSGKTEVYLQAIADVVAHGRQALVLVPEIALTPQTTRRFRERLGLDIAIVHSGLADGERARAWLAAAHGEARVVLGTRSAVFVPLPNAGLIVVDEEHDGSYKQQDGFRYHARDLAVVRARSLGVPIVLGSATPSIETLVNAQAGRYRSLRLAERTGVARPPQLQVMDLRHRKREGGLALESLQAIGEHLERGEQVLVFRNRRGYAPVLMCQACGWSAQCAQCDRPMTLHRGAARLRCHHCGADQRVPAQCPQCSSPSLAPQGQGTERLEEALRERFAQVPVVRIDRDTTRNRSGRDTLLASLDAPGARILVGTQMLAKGHDLPQLTLVVVVGVDEGLYSVDFRAGERLGQLIVQVAGRAGRAERAGRVILQTHHPDHPLLAALVDGGYHALAHKLIEERLAASLPPFAQLALVRAEARDASGNAAFLDAAAAVGRAHDHAVFLHGPMPAPMPRRAGYQRSQLLVECADRAIMQAFLGAWIAELRGLPQARRVRWSIDVDPVEMG